MYYHMNDVYQKGTDITIKMSDLLFVHICRKAEDKNPKYLEHHSLIL